MHKVLTDSGIEFGDQSRDRNTALSRKIRIDVICDANDIEHPLTKPNHQRTNVQTERMNRSMV